MSFPLPESALEFARERGPSIGLLRWLVVYCRGLLAYWALYKVVLLNDDYTPMEFVVEVLEKFFRMDRGKATQVMLHVHTRGKGVCGLFTYDIAETKVALVNQYSRDHQHPLQHR